VVAGEVELSVIGKIAQQFWEDIPKHFAHVHIDAYIIMPNHIHGIVIIDRPQIHRDNNVETLQCNVSTHCSTKRQLSQREFMSAISPNPGSLGAIARSYKSAVTRWCQKNGCDDFGWQPRFYEHIIRADESVDRIRQYITNNPAQWELDTDKVANLWM
jgi:REP element-mobilizing transposase RayT